MKEDNTKKDDAGMENPAIRIMKKPFFLPLVIILLLALAVFGIYYINLMNSRVYIEKSQVSVPIISLGPSTPGILEKVYVLEGDEVGKMTKIALVNGQFLYPKIHGIITLVNNVPGQMVSSSAPVVKMYDPKEIRLVGKIEEDKGLKYIIAGQRVVFTADAFPGKEYEGIVDSVSPTSVESDIVFSISDKREEHSFEVKVKYDTTKYPELKNGMSAKMWVYK